MSAEKIKDLGTSKTPEPPGCSARVLDLAKVFGKSILNLLYSFVDIVPSGVPLNEVDTKRLAFGDRIEILDTSATRFVFEVMETPIEIASEQKTRDLFIRDDEPYR